jgi:hypothetical protein
MWILQVGHITCDNDSSNGPAIGEMAVQLKAATGKEYDACKRRIK